MAKSKNKTAAELLAELEKDPAYRQRQAEEARATEQRRRFRLEAERPIVQELRGAGLPLQSVWDLVQRRESYQPAIPILVKHLQQSYPSKVREGMARALATPQLTDTEWHLIMTLFRNEDDSEVKWALACALKVNANEQHREDLLEMLLNPRHGKSRSVLAEALYRFRSPEVDQAFEGLRNDPEVGESIRQLLRTGSIVSD